MQRWTALALAVLLVGTIALVIAKGGPKPAPTKAIADAGADAALILDGGVVDLDASPATGPDDSPLGDGPATSDAGTTLLNGQVAPALGADAPKTIVFGEILIQYKGAQGAGPTARPREQALEMAKQLAEDAKKDFKAAVAKGDKGSLENAGRMPRGMLEPAPEFVLFSLAKDAVSDPVDSPRGYLILHRIE